MSQTRSQQSGLRRIASLLRRTPFHPQWLLGTRNREMRVVAEAARGRVLDIGCADRWIERSLSSDCTYIGVDYPITGGDLYGARPEVFADAGCLPFASDTMDTVLLLEVLEHLRAPDKALGEIQRVLEPGGQLFLSMPFLYPIHDAPHDYQRLTLHGLVRDLEAAGLRVTEVRPVMGSAETAGLIACLALAGMIMTSIEQRRISVVWLPLVLLAIVVLNLGSWIFARLLPTWGAVTSGYWLQARKP